MSLVSTLKLFLAKFFHFWICYSKFRKFLSPIFFFKNGRTFRKTQFTTRNNGLTVFKHLIYKIFLNGMRLQDIH